MYLLPSRFLSLTWMTLNKYQTFYSLDSRTVYTLAVYNKSSTTASHQSCMALSTHRVIVRQTSWNSSRPAFRSQLHTLHICSFTPHVRLSDGCTAVMLTTCCWLSGTNNHPSTCHDTHNHYTTRHVCRTTHTHRQTDRHVENNTSCLYRCC